MAPRSHPFLPEIEGLRALAVISVVVFHANPGWLPGGFVGVDIFFVISGFLITRLLLAEAQAIGRIDLPAFWARRVRRLLPNAALVLCTCIILTIALVAPFRWGVLTRDIAAAVLQVANYRFARSAVDYFSHDDPPSLVLHFWSLAVEEQFYMVWPLMVLALVWLAGRERLIARAILALSVIFAISFAIGLWHLASSQPRAFFQTEGRIWQLATGGLLAAFLPRLVALPTVMAATLRQVGLITALSACFVMSPEMAYPGWLALIPVAGAAAFIAGSASTDASATISFDPAGAIMRHPIALWIGARSYSWYLWHWPLILAADMIWPSIVWAKPLAATLSLGIAAVVYALIEDPIRRGRLLAAGSWRSLTAGAVSIAIVVMLAISVPPLAQRGSIGASPIAAEVASARTDFGQSTRDGCHLAYEIVVQPDCRYGDREGRWRVVLAGDSHAAQWFAPLDAAARQQGWALHAWTKSSCPLIDAPIWYPPRRVVFVECRAWREAIMTRLTGPDKPDLVIIANLADYGGSLWDDARQAVLDGQAAQDAHQRALAATLEQLVAAKVPVVVMRDTPQARRSYAECLSRGDPLRCARPRAQSVLSMTTDLAVAARFGEAVRSLDLTDRICGPDSCPAYREGMVVYQDHHHLTATFATTLADAFVPLLPRP